MNSRYLAYRLPERLGLVVSASDLLAANHRSDVNFFVYLNPEADCDREFQVAIVRHGIIDEKIIDRVSMILWEKFEARIVTAEDREAEAEAAEKDFQNN